MKDVFILQNHPASFKLDIAKLVRAESYALHLVTNPVGLAQLERRDQQALFASISVADELTLERIVACINPVRAQVGRPIDVVTNSEHAVSVCGKVRVHYGLAAEDNERFVDKLVMKMRLAAKGVRIPRHVAFDKRRATPADQAAIMAALPFPMFAKPINQAGSIGTAKLHTPAELASWVGAALASPYEFELDEFIVGTLYHCDSIIKDGAILYTQVGVYSRPSFDFVQGYAQASLTLPPVSEDARALRDFAARALTALGMPHAGVTHMEVFKASDGGFVFLEVAYRSPGTLIPAMYQRHLGLDIAALNIRLQIDPSFQPRLVRGPYVASIAYPNRPGTIVAVHELPATRSARAYEQRAKLGDNLAKAEVVRDFAASVLLWGFDYPALRADVDELSEFHPHMVAADPSSAS